MNKNDVTTGTFEIEYRVRCAKHEETAPNKDAALSWAALWDKEEGCGPHIVEHRLVDRYAGPWTPVEKP